MPAARGLLLPGLDLADIAPGRELLGPVCKVIWRGKSAEKIAAVDAADPRTGARWLSGEVQPPPIIFAAIHLVLTRW